MCLPRRAPPIRMYFDSDGEAESLPPTSLLSHHLCGRPQRQYRGWQPIVGAITEKKQAETHCKVIDQALAADMADPRFKKAPAVLLHCPRRAGEQVSPASPERRKRAMVVKRLAPLLLGVVTSLVKRQPAGQQTVPKEKSDRKQTWTDRFLTVRRGDRPYGYHRQCHLSGGRLFLGLNS